MEAEITIGAKGERTREGDKEKKARADLGRDPGKRTGERGSRGNWSRQRGRRTRKVQNQTVTESLSKTGDIMEDKEQKVRASQSVRVKRDLGDHLIQLAPSASMSLADRPTCTHTHSHLWTFAYAVPFT